MAEKPGPRSAWTAPPSWSAATSSGILACAWSRAVTAAIAATPFVRRPVRMTPPTW
jgi:hypothetical protein